MKCHHVFLIILMTFGDLKMVIFYDTLYDITTVGFHKSSDTVMLMSPNIMKLNHQKLSLSCLGLDPPFLSPPVLMHGGRLCIAFRLSVCPSVTRK